METSDYKEVFLTESREYLSTLNNALVTLEKDPSQAESINEIFRAAHTLKGMSATMGYEPMAHLTHQMETVLEPIRSGTKPLTPQLMDALFVCLDQLEKWVGILSSQDTLEEKDLTATLQTLQQAAETLRQASSEPPPSPEPAESGRLSFTQEEKDILSQARMNGFSVFKVMVELVEECAFKEVRAFMILRNVNGLGEIVKSLPSPEEVEKGLFGRGFVLVVVTDSTEEKLRQALMSVTEVKEVRIDSYRPEEEERREAGRRATDPPTPLRQGFEGQAPLQQSPEGSAVTPDEKSFMLPTIRVHTSKLDKLMALVQELVISKIRFEQVVHSKELKELLDPLFQLHHITDELQDEIMKVRLMPVKQIFDRFPRMVRDLAKSLAKQVDLEMDGAEVELDRTVIEEMSEPIVHLLRNAVDHGIELPDERIRDGKDAFGTIRLQAKRERSYVVISVSDNGKGVDPDLVRKRAVEKGLVSTDEVMKLSDDEVVRLIALPGFAERFK